MKLAVIGYGHRIRTVLKEIIKVDPSCHVAASVDPREAEIASELGNEAKHVAFYPTTKEMLKQIRPDGILKFTCTTAPEWRFTRLRLIPRRGMEAAMLYLQGTLWVFFMEKRILVHRLRKDFSAH